MASDHKWEQITNESDEFEYRRTCRMSVPGGWLYRYELDKPISDDARQSSLAMTFVPKPKTRGAKIRRRTGH
ncbi:MAG: hypothetical protein ACYSUI_22275 [Planctomycetota bacterium]|jgi:hypothetical protein